MKKLKILIILVVLLIFALLTCLVLIFNVNLNKGNVEEIYDEAAEEIVYLNKDDKSISNEVYFNVYNCLLKYMDYINTNNYIYQFSDKKDELMSENIYSLLSNEFITKNKITDKNAVKYVKTVSNKSIVVPIEIKALQKEDIYSFLVYGSVIETGSYKKNSDIYIIVNIDPINLAFSVEPLNITKSVKFDEIEVGNLETKLTLNSENKYNVFNETTEMVVKEYINRYKYLALADPEKAYEYLDEKYREKRFGSVNEFKKYVLENRDEIIKITLKEYQVNDKTYYKEYVGKDSKDNLYIINEYDVLNYDMKLDSYTILTEKFITEYYKVSNIKKVMMNIDKFFKMINAKDYKNAYNCLANSFKSNYFKTQASFEKYIKNNTFKYNNVEYINLNDSVEGIYAYELKLVDKTNNSNIKNFSIIVKLKEATDFEISFDVK